MIELNHMFTEFNTQYGIALKPINNANILNAATLAQEEVYEAQQEVVPDTELNKHNAVKELLDIIYVTAQQLSAMGVNLETGLRMVHLSNMSKLVHAANAINELNLAKERYPEAYLQSGKVLKDKATGKVIKPSTYSKANISAALPK